MLDFENDIEIDVNALETEWINQPSLALKYSNHWADAKHELDKLEEGITLIRSELVRDVHENPQERTGVPKPTGLIIEQYYRLHKKHIEQKEKIVQARYNLDIAEGAKKEISITRKAALENLVKLLGLNYFAGPSIPRDLSSSAAFSNKSKAISKESDKSIGKRMKRHKKQVKFYDGDEFLND